MEPIKAAEGETVSRMFQSRVQLSGDRIALRYKKLGIWRDVTWKQYNQKVKEVCLALLSLGLKAGSVFRSSERTVRSGSISTWEPCMRKGRPSGYMPPTAGTSAGM